MWISTAIWLVYNCRIELAGARLCYQPEYPITAESKADLFGLWEVRKTVMGRSKHHDNPQKTAASKKDTSKLTQQSEQGSQQQLPADLGRLSSTERILNLQRQIGNRSVTRLLDRHGAGLVQRDARGLAEKAREAFDKKESAREEKEGQVHEFDKETYEEKLPLAKHMAERLGIIMEADYDKMIQDATGMQAINVTAKVDRYLNAAFSHEEAMYDDYIGSENLPLVLEQINAVPGLYEKLGLLRAMEPHHAKLIGSYLGIPPLKGFNYEISTLAAGVGPEEVGPIGFQATEVKIACFQGSDELWRQTFFLGAVGVAAGAEIEASLTEASGTFETLIFWSPGDFEGQMRLGSASAGVWKIGYSFGVGTFMGDGSKGSLTIDMSGKIVTTAELGAGAFVGYLSMVGEGSRSAGPKTETLGYEPKIKVTEDIDKEMVITFPENSDKAGGSFKDDFVKFLGKALTAERLHATITGTTKVNKPYNVELMKLRVKSTREIIEEVVEEREIDPQRVHIEEVEKVLDEEPGKWKDHPRDRATRVHLKGTITVRNPDE